MKFEICHIFVIHKKPTQVLENFSFQSIPTSFGEKSIKKVEKLGSCFIIFHLISSSTNSYF